MAPQTGRSLIKDFRASFRKKKVADVKAPKAKEQEDLSRVAELKEIFGPNIPSIYTDADLASFIRARQQDVKEAEKLLKLDINLKKFVMLDDFVEKNNQLDEVNTKFSLSGVIGFDKEGSLVRVINIGRGDSKGIFHSVSTIENFRIFLWFIMKDRILQEMENKRTGRKQHQIVYIIDMDEITMGKVMFKPALDTGLLSLKLLQDHYHDLPKAVFCVNAPSYYSTIYKLVKPVLQESLQKKIRIFSSGDNWKDELLKHIDADVLPGYLGGNRTGEDGDPFCKSLIGFGGVVPERYYSTSFLDPKDPDVQVITVPAGSFVNTRVRCPKVGMIFRWHFQAKENDIGIGLFIDNESEDHHDASDKDKSKKRCEDVSKMEPITPVIRSQCHICPEVGHTISWFHGTVVVHFDNSYSWMSSKEVLFKVTAEESNNNQ